MALAFPTAAVVERLMGAESIALVGIAADLNAALATPPRAMPAVYVITSTSGGPIKYSGSPTQQERVTTLVLLCWVRNHGTAAASRAAMDALLATIDARLAGWAPNDACAEVQFVASRDEFAAGQHQVAQATYQSSWNFIAPLQP